MCSLICSQSLSPAVAKSNTNSELKPSMGAFLSIPELGPVINIEWMHPCTAGRWNSTECCLCFWEQKQWGMQSRSCATRPEWFKKMPAKMGLSMEISKIGIVEPFPLERKTNLHQNEKKGNNEEVEWGILVVLQSEYKETRGESKWWQIENVLKGNSFSPALN